MLTVAGSFCSASRFTWFTASPMEVPGFRLKESVTLGSCPACWMVSGPRSCVSVDTAGSGTSWPVEERT